MATLEELKKRAKQEYEEEQNRKKEQTTSQPTNSGASSLDALKKRAKQEYDAERTKVVDSSYINSFLDSTNKFFSSVEEETGKVGWGNASTAYQSRANTWNDLDQRRGIIRSWLDLNKDKYAPEDYEEFAGYLDALGNDATSVLDWFKGTKDFYSQWETEDQYNFWEARNTTEGRQNLYADQKKRVAQLEADLKAENARWSEVDPIMMGVESAEFKSASDAHLKKVAEIQDEIASIQTEMRNYERGNRNQYGQDYGNKTLDTYTAKHLSNPEFIQAASNREYGNANVDDHVRYKALNDASTWTYDVDGTIRATDGTIIVDDGNGNLIHPGTVGLNTINDRLGMYISATEEERLMPAASISGELSQVMTEGATKHWELLTEDELTLYYGLRNTEGQESADNFLDSIQTTLDMRSTERSIKATQEQYDDSGFLGRIMLNVATFPANLVSGVAGGVEDAIALMKGEDINPYSSAHAGMHYTQTVRGKTAQDIDKNAKPDAFFTWGDLYQSGMSLGDSLLAMGIGGAYGGALLAMGAAENEAYRLYQQGASTGQIAAGAALAGAAEMVFESISIDKLINMKDATSLLQVVKNALIQGGVEASEEAFTEIANTITNAIVLGQQSDWAKLVEANGGNNFDAFMEVLRNVGHSALSGFFSGAGSGGLVSGANYAANYAEQQGAYADAGRLIMETDGGVDALKALAMDVSGAKGSLARQAKRTTSSGKAANVGKLYHKTGEAISKMNRTDIESSLVEKGFSKKEAKRIGEYLHKASAGGYFTYEEQNEVENDQRIIEVLRDVVGNQESTINQRTKKFIEAFLPKSSTASTSGKGIPTETSYTVSKSGKTTLDGAEVKIGSLRKLDDGSIVVATADNQTADPSEVEYPDKGTALVFESYSTPDIHSSNPVIANMPVADRSALAMGYDPASGIDGRLWVVGSNEAYWYGFEGISLGTLPASSFAKHLPQEQITKAYALGRAAAEASAKAQSESVQATYDQAVEKLGGKEKAKAAVKKAGKVILEHSLSESSMTSQQKASYKLTQAVASTSGTTVHVYRGGKERGYYDPKTGDVWLNIDADANAQSYMVFTLGHELAHKAKDLSSAKFKLFADTLLEKYGEKGISVETLIQNKIKQYADHGITLDEHAAWEEVIADACQAMLLDTNAVETMAEFRDANPGFWQKVVDTIKEFIEKIRLALKGVEPDSEEAQHFKKLDAAAQKILENLFVDMVMDASQKGAVIKAANGTLSVEQYMETKDIKYNLAAVNKHKSNLETKYSEESTVPLVTLMARYNKILDIWTKLGGELNSQFLKEWDSKVSTDRTFTIFKAQSGYKYNVELSSMCKKGVPLFEAIDTIVKQEVMKELGIETLGKAEKEILYDILKSHHFEIPCAICYVEQARQREGAIIDAFLNGKVVKNASGKTTQFKLGWNEVLDAVESEMRANGVEYSFAQVSRDLATEAYAPANLDMDEKTQAAFFEALKKIANQEITRYNKDEKKSRSLLGDVTPEAVKACFKGTLPSNLKIFKVLFTEPSSRFKIQHDLLYSSIATQNLSKAHHELYGLFNSQGGVSGYKTKQGTTIYWGDILGKSWTPDTLRKEGGVRNQSNSDFQMYTLLDQAQMYIDFTAKGYYLQAYTKVLSELKLFGLSRGKINASLIPRVVVYRNADGTVDVEKTMATAGLDEKGNPIYDDIEGINHAEAFMLIADPEYSKSITGICIGYSDAHIRKLLDVDGVQLIIGFHDKTDDGEKRYRGARYAKNYNGLNEAVKYDAEGKPKTVHIGFNPYVKKAEGRFRYNEETETFEGTTTFKGKEYTADDIPRLAADMYLDMCEKKGYTPAYNDFKDHRNYYKLLADFGLYDSQGHYAPHRKVAYNMPDQVPYLDANGNKQYMKSYDYIREELRRELIVRDDISDALADQSSEGIIPQFKAKVEEMRGHTIPEGAKRSMPKVDSEGKRLSEDQQEYFEDSKARDENGNLYVLFHGSRSPLFTEFDMYEGVWLTPDQRYAEVYAETWHSWRGNGKRLTGLEKSVYADPDYRVYRMYANITNPLNLGEINDDFDRKQLSRLAKLLGVPSSKIKGLAYDDDGYETIAFVYQLTKQKEFIDIAREKGYDGFIATEKGIKTFCAFNSPNQVKLTTNEVPSSFYDIRYALPNGGSKNGIDNSDLIDENGSIPNSTRGGNGDNRRVRKGASETSRGFTPDGRANPERTENSQKNKSWGDLSPADKKRIVGIVDDYIGNSNRYDELFGLLCSIVHRTEDEITSRMLKKAITMFSEQLFDDAMKMNPSEFELRWSIIGNGVTGLFRDLRIAAGVKFKTPNSRGLSTRELLADAFEEMVQTPQERQMIDEYRANISKVEDVQDRLKKVRAKIHELTVSKGDKVKIAELTKTAADLADLIDKYDRKLLEMEASKPLRDVLARAKQAAYREAKQKGEERMAEYRQKVSERFDRGVESRKKTAMRQKIRKVIRDLDKILNRGDKKRNVKEGMKGFVEEALASAEILFIDNYGNEDMIRNGVEVEMTPEEEKYMTEARAILAELYNLPSGSYEAWAERQGVEESLKSKLAYRIGKLKDVFYRERLRLNKTKVADVLSKLADAYAKLETSEYAYVNGAYNEAVHQYLKTLQDEVGGATIKDMSLSQLELMHTAYKMVLHSVRKANEMFTEGWTKRRDELANGIMFEVRNVGGVHGRWSPLEIKQNQASWNNTKPIYAAERIGSETFKQLWAGLFKGQYNWALDMEEAKLFRQKVAEKYGAKAWDMEKMYTFTSASGLEFQLNLNQIMSIYAYSKREQAHDHLTKGGFVFGRDTEVIVNEHGIKKTYFDRSASAYKVSDELIEEIVGVLDKVPGAKKFVDEMQDYLSTTMGEKGNEVSLKLYGVKLFNEAFYFPLRSAGQYMERAKEADLKKQQGQVSIENSSFTHATKPKANNPVVLEGFMDVWASHVNEMSLYHSMVLPMEDFRRVYNYSSPNMEGQDSVSVNGVIENAYGPEATGYFDQLYKELNGGAVTDPRETAFKERIGKFKKAAVMLSSSVVVQQFSSVGRAYALIDPQYFVGAKVDKKKHKLLWEELKQYAPVAIIKEMGGFDTGMGGSAKDFLLAEEYGKGERIKGFINDEQYRSEIMGLAPAKADELTWCVIWEAVKRETKANNPNMDVTSEEFLKKAGERFSEVIEKTQVYDSVLARSANMRSKNGLMQMATAFLAEPTTTVNMIEDALRKKDKKYIARTFGAVFTSIVINNALASIVYAMRDDDEDETFLEKYTQAFTSGMLDDINPLTYYPFLKDVWSLLQGYDVERSDMSVVSDVVDAVKKVTMTFAKRDDDMSEEELAEYRKEIGSGLLGLLNAGLNALGIPFKNVHREISAIANTFKTFSKTFGSTTWNSFVDALGSSVLDSTPIVGIFAGESRTDKIYDAIISGDSTYLKRLKVGYKSEDAYNTAVRKALRENDPRIHQAALAGFNGDPSERVRIARLIIADGFSQDNVVAAINAEINKMEPDKEKSAPKAKGFYTAEDFAREIANGDQASANAVKVDIIQTAQKNGKSAEDAKKSFVSSAKTELKELFLSGRISEQKAINALTTYCDIEESDAIADVQYWAFKQEFPEVFADDQWFDTYYEKVADSGIEIDVYMEYRNAVAGITGENKKAGRMSVINSLPITSAQKDALYLAEGWAASKLNEAPWH